MRPFYAVILAHCLATFVMLMALAVAEPASRHDADAQDVLVLALSPLFSWYMLLESIQRFDAKHTSVVWCSYLIGFTVGLAASMKLGRFAARTDRSSGARPSSSSSSPR